VSELAKAVLALDLSATVTGNAIFTANKYNRILSVLPVSNKAPMCLHVNHQKLMYISLPDGDRDNLRNVGDYLHFVAY
jgi:hypothetical protein